MTDLTSPTMPCPWGHLPRTTPSTDAHGTQVVPTTPSAPRWSTTQLQAALGDPRPDAFKPRSATRYQAGRIADAAQPP